MGALQPLKQKNLLATSGVVFIGDIWCGPYSPAVFSSQRYATLFVNYRGSLGYSVWFTNLNEKDLRGGDFKAIMAGVDFLVKDGIADPEQLFITGHSYGGFMATWAIGHTNRFKAAVMRRSFGLDHQYSPNRRPSNNEELLWQ